MKGRTLAEAKAQLTAKGMDEAKADQIAPHRVFTGNRPSITFVYDKLDPVRARPPDRALRAPRLRRRRALRHQLLRPVGRRARQGTGDRACCRWSRARKAPPVTIRPPAGLVDRAAEGRRLEVSDHGPRFSRAAAAPQVRRFAPPSPAGGENRGERDGNVRQLKSVPLPVRGKPASPVLALAASRVFPLLPAGVARRRQRGMRGLSCRVRLPAPSSPRWGEDGQGLFQPDFAGPGRVGAGAGDGDGGGLGGQRQRVARPSPRADGDLRPWSGGRCASARPGRRRRRCRRRRSYRPPSTRSPATSTLTSLRVAVGAVGALGDDHQLRRPVEASSAASSSWSTVHAEPFEVLVGELDDVGLRGHALDAAVVGLLVLDETGADVGIERDDAASRVRGPAAPRRWRRRARGSG